MSWNRASTTLEQKWGQKEEALPHHHHCLHLRSLMPNQKNLLLLNKWIKKDTTQSYVLILISVFVWWYFTHFMLNVCLYWFLCFFFFYLTINFVLYCFKIYIPIAIPCFWKKKNRLHLLRILSLTQLV